MPQDYRHSFWATGSLIIQYLFLLVAVFALLRFIGLGLLASVAAALFAVICAVLIRRR